MYIFENCIKINGNADWAQFWYVIIKFHEKNIFKKLFQFSRNSSRVAPPYYICMSTLIHTCIRKYFVYIHIHTHIYIYTYTYIYHIQIRTHTYIYKNSLDCYQENVVICSNKVVVSSFGYWLERSTCILQVFQVAWYTDALAVTTYVD